MPAEMAKRLEDEEIWLQRRMLRVSLTDHVSNKEVLERVGRERKLLKTIRRKQLEFLGHVATCSREREVGEPGTNGKNRGEERQDDNG